MAHVPLDNASIDVAVFSLALMGTDYGLFLLEAARVLRHKGWLWIAEVSGLSMWLLMVKGASVRCQLKGQ